MILILTLVSALAAIGFGWFAWRLLADDRRRSEARVAALSNAIDAAETTARPDRTPAPHVAVSRLFEPEHSDAARGIPLIRLAVGLAMALIVIVALTAGQRGGPASSASAEADAGGAERTVSQGPAAPLELISMRHEREGDTLKVMGLVRNPRRGNNVERVTAVVFVFDRAGAFVASGRAALDFTKLEPGDESPFVVSVPAVADVGRYRVSFRTDAGVMRHLDRRAEQTRLATTALTR